MDTINFTRGVPANESFPLDEVASAAIEALKARGPAMLQYGPSAGFQPLREWIAQWQGVTPDRVLTGNGSLQIVEFLCLGLLKPGDVVFTENPTYDRTITMLARHGMEVVGIPLVADGPDIAALEAAIAKRKPKVFYLIPDFQNPSGTTCSGDKRRKLAELAHKHDFLIVEDAPYRPLRYRGSEEPSIYSLAPERTLFMCSFTKLIAPGVRTGFMIGRPDLIHKLAKVAEDTYISPGYLAQGITYEWCRRGLLQPQIERLKALYLPRLDACLAALDSHMPGAVEARPDGGFFVSLTLPEGVLTSTAAVEARPDGGFFVSLTLPEGVLTSTVRAEAAKRSLNLSDGLAFFPNGGGERFLRLPFCALTPGEIQEGVRRLAESVEASRK